MRRLRDIGKDIGINFTGKAGKTPFTPAAHVLLEYTRELDGGNKQNEVQEALFKVGTRDRSGCEERREVEDDSSGLRGAQASRVL